MSTTSRVRSIDLLRGIVMIIMALDHTRDYFTSFRGDPTDLTIPFGEPGYVSSALFFTRWITHYCAPIFVFLSGVSAWLSLQKGRTKTQAAGFLFTRGLWLVILEVTLVRLGWQFNLDYHATMLQVIWAIGVSMMVLAALSFLPRWAIGTFGLLLIFGHNSYILDHALQWDTQQTALSHVLHIQGPLWVRGGDYVVVLYPLIPWIGVMAAGYAFAPVFKLPEASRNRVLLFTGLSAVALFILLRATHVYGDPRDWSPQGDTLRTLASFLNVEKYPPSLLYLLMTLGPGLLLMPLLERWTGKASEVVMVYGKVPMFYYLLHIFLIHGLALLTGVSLGLPVHTFTDMERIFAPGNHWGFGLLAVYGWWALVIVLLYLPCRWYAGVKMRHKHWWLSYL